MTVFRRLSCGDAVFGIFFAVLPCFTAPHVPLFKSDSSIKEGQGTVALFVEMSGGFVARSEIKTSQSLYNLELKCWEK